MEIVVAVERMATMMVAASQVGCAARRRAATPAASGAAALVPMAWTYWAWPRLKQPKLWAESVGRPSVVAGLPELQAPRTHPLTVWSPPAGRLPPGAARALSGAP